jgi:hypothetical protein
VIGQTQLRCSVRICTVWSTKIVYLGGRVTLSQEIPSLAFIE